MNVRVNVEGETLFVVCPFDQEFLSAARLIGGSFGGDKRWRFDARDEQRVRELLRQVFGTDGTREDGADLVTVRVHLRPCETDQRGQATAVFAGRRIATRPSRDEPVRLAMNVVLVEGQLSPDGGSVARPSIDAPSAAIVEVRDIPRATLELAEPGSYTIVEELADADRLRAERERLVARLAEIDALLAR